jgi:hypothetical protein
MSRILAAVIAIASGILVLAGYFVPALEGLQATLLNWAIILTGMAAVIGVFNLVSVHGEKLRTQAKGSIYSGFLLISLIATFIFVGVYLAFVPNPDAVQALVSGVIVPAEAALMAIISVSLIYAAMHMLRQRVSAMNIVFLSVAVLVLIGTLTLPFGQIPILGDTLRPWLSYVLALGGARGILIGVALGSLTTALRVLMAIDRPYGGK